MENWNVDINQFPKTKKETQTMKRKLILSSIVGLIVLAALIPLSSGMINLSQSKKETTAKPDWWVGYYAGFEVTQDSNNPLPDGTPFGVKVIVNNLYRLYHYDIQVNAGSYEHLGVFRILDANIDYNLNPEPSNEKLWFPYSYDLNLPVGYTQLARNAWYGFEVSRYGTGENSAWVFEWSGVTSSYQDISLSLDFLYLLQNRGSDPSVNSPPTIQVITSAGLVSTQYNTYNVA